MLAVPQSTVTRSPAPCSLSAPDGLDVRAITLGDPVGDMDDVVEPAGAQIFRQQGRAAGAVHVVIAEDRHFLAGKHRVRQPVRRDLHVGHHMGIRHEIAQAGVEEPLHVGDAHASSGKNPREHVRQAMGLRDGERDRTLRRIAALDPGAAEGRASDAEERAGHRERKS